MSEKSLGASISKFSLMLKVNKTSLLHLQVTVNIAVHSAIVSGGNHYG